MMALTRQELDAHIPTGDADYDVIVCGGGLAGMGAALASAACGARTLLLESRGYLGGIGTICLWMPINHLYRPGRHDPARWRLNPPRTSRGGVIERLVQKIESLGPDAGNRCCVGRNGSDAGGIAVHPDYFRVACYEVLEEAGCHYRLYSPIHGVLKEGDRVNGVVAGCKEGRREYRARVVIDTTGDADVAHLAGVQTQKGRGPGGLMMPVTLTFVLGGVHYQRLYAFKPNIHLPNKDITRKTPAELEAEYRKNPATVTSDDDTFYAIVEEARKQGYFTAMWYAFTVTTLPDVVSVNNGGPYNAGNIDGTNSGDLTFAERYGAKIATDFVRIAHQWQIPGLERCWLMRTAPEVAVRQTRRILGDYVLTGDDLRAGTEFPDTVARNLDGVIDTVYYHGQSKQNTAIPYRCLLPKGVEGMLVAGRCFSGNEEGGGGCRGMGTMMGMGQAAGVAAALAAKHGVTPRQINAREIQGALAQMGVRL